MTRPDLSDGGIGDQSIMDIAHSESQAMACCRFAIT
jgi:hypothetical protein